MSKKIKAWHFTGSTLRDGRPIPPLGEKLIHEGELVLYEAGLQASGKILDALAYAPGRYVHRVVSAGDIIESETGDKLVSSERTILWSLDAIEVLRRFTCLCALDVIHFWSAPEVVVKYLRTGNDDLRAATWAAAQEATREATQAAARTAARTATQAAAWEAAWEVAWEAAWDAARTTAQAAASAVASAAASAAVWNVAWAATWDAAQAAARAVASAVAWNAAREKQNRRLTRMIYEARRAA